MQIQVAGYIIAGIFTVATVVLSGWQIWTHLLYNPIPNIRKFIIRILLMVPIYACTSFLALFGGQNLLFETVRDCYEAFVLYSFYGFLVEYLGGKAVLANTLRAKDPNLGHHSTPCCCLKPWSMGNKFLHMASIGILQYIPIKVLMSILTIVTSLGQIYGDGEFFNARVAYPYICLIMNVSQCYALYCLVLFFLGTRDELAPVKPLPKFLAIKAIIFFTYWQSIMISVLEVLDVISADWDIGCDAQGQACWSAARIASGLNDFIICNEMLVFAIAHHFVFPIGDFRHPGTMNSEHHLVSNAKAPLLANLMDAINVTDVSIDIKNSRQQILTKKQALAAKFDT